MKFIHFIWIITFVSNFYNIYGVYTDCERPPSVHHGNAKLTEDDDGNMVTATYYCDNGFKLSGDIKEIKCDLDTDEWKGDLPKCEEIEQSGGGSSSEAETEASGKQRQRKQKGRQEIQEETNIDSTFASGLDLSCIGREIKRPPSIENAALVKYNRRKKDGNIFLVAFYECNDEYELEVPEHDRLYCSKEHWVGPEPVCIAVEYDENDNEDEDDYGDEDDEQYNEEDEGGDNEEEEEEEEENEYEDEDDKENKRRNEIDNGGKHEDEDTHENKNDIDEHINETTTGADVDIAAATSTTEKMSVNNEINENKNDDQDVSKPHSSNENKIDRCESNRGGCDHECQVIRKPNDVDDGQIQCSCYTGFILDEIDGKRCLDINECDNNNGGCEQTCNNTPGSFECTCTEGLQIDTVNGKTCIDINECLLRNGHGPCQDTCFNTWSSYYCTCDGLPGTRLSTNMHDCEDAGTCSIKNGGCSHLCMTTYGRIHCLCDPGYILGDDWKTCKDINECNDPNISCPYECENTMGSYRCLNETIVVPEIKEDNRETNKIREETDNDGDTEEDADDDDDVDQEEEDDDDDENKEDNAIIATNDNRVNIEKCEDGFEWDGHRNKCVDIDECALGQTGCEYCTNVEGGYECTCPDGYDLMDDEKHCQDINECEQYADYDENDSRESQSGSICSHECRNLPGSYECKCPENFHLQYDRRTCTRDFCDDLLKLTDKIKCSHECYDDSNGFVCKCPDQYDLDSDFKTCVQKTGHIQHQWCPLKHNPCTPGECINITSGYTCECPEGYTLTADNHCQDINECDEHSPEHGHRCSHECRNTAGSYECSCPTGYELDEDEINCRPVSLCQHQNGGCSDICHYIHNTAVTCECYEGRRLSSDLRTCESKSFCDDDDGGGGCQQICLNEEQRCACNAGYELDSANAKLCNDIDECLVDNGGCHHHCYNTNGSFSCACAQGFKTDDAQNGQICIDIDECRENRPCDHHCTNTDGSYKCTCQEGFQIGPDNHKCLDINECDLDNGNCSHICINLLGGFQCSCPHGQYLINDDSICSFVNECEINNGGCSHECKYFEGTVFCNCPNGYELRNDDRKNCLDINECDLNNGDCSHICENHIGHYTCRCNNGYQLGNDRRSCTDIDECIDDNGNCSNICVNLLGSHTCTCESGFELTADKRTCIDINECTEDIHDCSHECINIAGTYECSCPPGYRLGHDHFTCEDINECTQLTTTAACSDNCINTLGSYYCTCPIGHELDRNDNKTCIDINECDYDDDDDLDEKTNTDNEVNLYNYKINKNIRRCSHDCKNTIGSFHCLCPIGLQLSENRMTCLDIDECTNDKHNVNGGCSQLCENFEGSYRCKCLPGYQLNGDHLTCSDIDECQQNNGDCEQICTNTNGSHYCGCHSDLILKSDGRHCQSTNPCHDNNNNGGCEHICNWNGYVGGKAQCSCNKGFQLNGDDNRSCNDIDECKLNTAKQYCQHTCTNTIGSYRCDCPRGHRLNDHNQCIDIDECQHLNGGCPKDSKCLNLVGGHRCLCSAGFKLSQDRRACVELRDNCKPIKSPRYGELRCTRSRHRTQLFYKTKCTVKCHKGYKLVGPSIKHCNGSGQWDDDGEPICVPQSCPRLPRPEKGVISPLNCMSGKIFAGERCILHCPVGYKPFNQQRTAVCNTEQNWIPNPNLYCIPIIEMSTSRTIIGSQVPSSPSPPASSSSSASLQTDKIFKPFIKCPQDTTIILPKNQRTVYIKLEQPKTNVDWWRYIDSHPAWGKQLQARLAPGEHIITFRARSPHSNVNVICRTIITVKESQPPQVVYCPQSIEYQLQPYEMSRSIFWKEPVFRSSAHLKSIFKSKIPGNALKPGVHQITYIATDLHNQTSKCEFTINVKRYAASASATAAESTILVPTTTIEGNNHHERTISQSSSSSSSSSGYSQVNQLENRLENHESYLMCPDKPALKIETNIPLHLPPGCYVKNVRIKQFNHHRRRHNISKNNMLKHYSSWDTGKNKRMLAFHSFHNHRGGRGWL